MIDLTNLTTEQANKIECVLLALEHEVKENIDGYKELLDEDFPEKVRTTLRNTLAWWQDAHDLIYNN